MDPPHITKVEVQPSQGGIEVTLHVRNDNVLRSLLDARMDLVVRGSNRLLGRGFMLYPDFAWDWARLGNNMISFRVRIGRGELQPIEEERNGRPLDLEILAVLVGTNREAGPKGENSFRLLLKTDHRIERSLWVEQILPQLTDMEYQLWEFSSPRSGVMVLAAEAKYLKEAIKDYNEGDFADSFRDCRDLVEAILQRETELKLEALVGGEEWKRAKHFFSVALHSTIGATINRDDAAFGIAIAGALLKRVDAALQRPKTGK